MSLQDSDYYYCTHINNNNNNKFETNNLLTNTNHVNKWKKNTANSNNFSNNDSNPLKSKHTNTESKYFYRRMSCLQATSTEDNATNLNNPNTPNNNNSNSNMNAIISNSLNSNPPSEFKQTTSRPEFVVDNLNALRMKKYILEYPYKPIRHKTNNIFIWNIFKLGLLFLINFIIMTPILTYLAVVYPLNQLFKYTFKLFHLCHLTATSHLSPNSVPEFLKPMELFWLYNSNLINSNNTNFNSSSQLTSHNDKNICSCIVFVEGNLSKKNVKDLVQNRIISSNVRTGQRFLARFTQRLYRLFAYGYVWLDCDSTFSIDDHIVEIDSLQEINTNEQLQAYVGKLIQTHEFKITKPLWQIFYKKNFNANGEQSTVLIFLFHMCFADGISLVRLFFKTIVDNRNTLDVKARFAYSRLKTDLVRQFFFSFNKIFYYLICKKHDKSPLNRMSRKKFKDLNSEINLTSSTSNSDCKQTLRWSEPFSLVLINRLKLVTRSKLNDFLISTVAGIIRDYLQKKGINNPQNVNCLMPVNLTSNRYPFELSNQTVLCSFKLPSNTEGCIPRLWSTKLATSKLKYSSDYLFIYFFICVVFNALPHWLAVHLIRRLINKNTIIASTLGAGDSTLSTVSLCNKNVRNILFIYPTLCKISISFSIITYGDEVRLCLLADSDIIKNPDQITKEFIKQLETLNYLLANRRIPGEIRRGIKPSLIQALNTKPSPVSSSTNPSTSDNSIEEMQNKLNEIHHELQVLADVYQNLDSTSLDFNKQKQVLNLKRENLKKEFRGVLIKLQMKKSSFHKTIPSDDEDEMDPEERVRLRSSSVASRSSGSSTSRKIRESNSEYEKSSRKPSISYASRQNSRSSISNSIGYLKSNSNLCVRNDNEIIRNNGNSPSINKS